MLQRSALLLTSLLLAACAATAPPLPGGQVVGEEMKARPVVAFAVVDARPSDYFDRIVLVEATVTAVCQQKGCWMQVEDEGRTAMVRWETGCGGRYAFPEEMVGQRVLIQGSFYPKVLSDEDYEHLQEEAPEGIVIPREGYEFNASSVLLLD
jgi:hypothetical protein